MKYLPKLLFLVISIVFISCNKEETGPQRDSIDGGNGQYQEGMLIANEGNFGSNNASVTHLDLNNEQPTNDIYSNANEGKRLGDVLQSIAIEGERTYLVVNNSKKIEVLDSKTFKRITTINGLNSPRYLQFVNQNKAYVSNFTLSNTGSLQIIDPLGEVITDNIEMEGWTEKMVLTDDVLWVCNMTKGSVQLVDVNSDIIVKEILLAKEPNSIVKGINGSIWILCSGGFSEEKPALFEINPSTYEVIKHQLSFSIQDSPSNLCLTEDKDSLYFLNKHVYKLAVDNPDAGLVKTVDLSNYQYPYGLNVGGVDNRVYVTEAYDFQRDGKLFCYSTSGKLMRQYQVGEGPSYMLRINN